MAEKKIVRRGTGPFAISGSDLRTGHVVWLAAGDRWVDRYEDALILQSEAETAARMALVTADRRELAVVDTHVVDVAGGPGHAPVTYRERVRAFGPTTAYGRHPPAGAAP